MSTFSVGEIFDKLDQLAPQFGMDPAVAKTLILAENTKNGNVPPRSALFRGDATNKNQTMGLGQVIPSTAEGLKQAGFLPPDWKHDPKNLDSQLSASLAAMKEMKGRQRDPRDALELGAMYNGGNVPWEQYKSGRPMNPETTQYLQKMRTSMAELNMTPQQIEQMASKPGGVSLPAGTRVPGVRTGTSSSTSISSKTYDPVDMERFSQAAGLMQRPGGLFDSALNALDERGIGKQETGADLVGSILAAGQAAGASASAAATLKAAGEARRAALLTRANLNPEQTNNRMDQALSALDNTSIQLESLKPEIDKRMSVGFFDNPLEYVVNMTRLPGMIGKYNSLVSTQQAALGKYNAAKEIATSSIDMSQAIDADATLAVGAAVDREKLAQAQADADKTRVALQSRTAAEALQKVAVGMQATDLTLKQLALKQQNEALREGESATDAAAKGEAAALSQFNIMIEAAGGEKIAMDRFKQKSAKERDEILNTTSSRRFGGDFVSGLQFVLKYGNLDNMAVKGQAEVRTWVNATDQAVDTQVRANMKLADSPLPPPHLKNYDPLKDKKELLNAQASRYVAAAEVDMRGEKDGNPYKISYPRLLDKPEFANNIWVQDLKKYGPSSPNGIYADYDEQNFMRRALKVIGTSKDPQAAVQRYAADISSFYREASKKQQDMTKPQMFGMATPSKSYALQLPQLSVGPAKTVDMGNQSQVENLFVRNIVEQIRSGADWSIMGSYDPKELRSDLFPGIGMPKE